MGGDDNPKLKTSRHSPLLPLPWSSSQLELMETVASMIIPSLGKFFSILEEFSWIGSATNIVHLENTIIDQTVENLATQLSMQVPLMKVPLLSPFILLRTLTPPEVYPHAISCHSIRCHHEMDPITNSQTSLFHGHWDLIDAMDLC
jgi:hypothetical protein